MEVGASLAFVEQLQCFLGRNVQTLGQLHGDRAVDSIQVATKAIITCVFGISITFFITNERYGFHLAKIYFFMLSKNNALALSFDVAKIQIFFCSAILVLYDKRKRHRQSFDYQCLSFDF